MKFLIGFLGFSTICLVLTGCATLPPPGSRDEAVNMAWERLCGSGYCEGFQGRIDSRTENSLTVIINGNTRYVKYTVSGDPGNYSVRMRPTANGGRARP